MTATAQYFCYVEPNKLSLIGNNGISVAIPLSVELMTDLEIVDREKLIAFIGQFLQANNVPIGAVTFLLAATNLFEQDLSAVAPKDLDVAAQKFSDSVPFESVASKRILVGDKLRLIAANRDVLDALKKAFEKKGFVAQACVPYTVIQVLVPELAQSIDPPLLFSKLDSFRQYSLVSQDIIIPTAFEKKTGLKGRRDMILISVFGVLMLFLLYLVLVTYVFVPKPQKVVPPAVVPAPTRPLVFPTQEATQSSQVVSPTVLPKPSGSRVITP